MRNEVSPVYRGLGWQARDVYTLMRRVAPDVIRSLDAAREAWFDHRDRLARAQKLNGKTPEAIGRLARLGGALPTDGWSEAAIEAAVSGFAEAEAAKLGDIAQPLRAALTGSNASPSLFEVMEILGPDETKARIEAVCGSAQQAID